MIISNILRTVSGCLSSWYPNDNISFKKDEKIRKQILKNLDEIKIDNRYLKNTHKFFNRSIHLLLRNKNLKSFLRKNFIQKMFFLQNRFFVFNELLEMKKSNTWKFYEKLLQEDHIGNPIRYFLYLKSSGNRINHVFHLNILENELKINLKKKIKTVFEFGAGYGCMARIFSKINKNIKYICFDTSYVNLLQFYYLKHNNLNVGFKKSNNFFLMSNIKNKVIKNDLFIANWSLSETPINFRKKFFPNIFNSKYILIAFQEKFEEINNLKYFNQLKSKMKNKFQIKIFKNKYYRGNFLSKQNHYFFIGKKV